MENITKNILITGVSRGLGLEIARVVLEAGWTVYGVSRTESADWKRLAGVYPERAHFHCCDLSQPGATPDEIFRGFVPYAVPLHGLVNNAAEAYDDLATNMDLDRVETMFATNVFSPMALTRAAIRNMLFHRIAGSVVFISSVSTAAGYKGLSMYAASKGALEAFSRNLAREWGPREIRFNCVAPGFMETEMSASLSDEQREKIYRRSALKKATEAASVASTVHFLLSDKSGSITGQCLKVDAGSA